MFQLVLFTITLFAGSDAVIKQYDTCNLLLHDRYSCNEDNLCFYGCHEGYCWSQCNAVAKFTWDGPPGTCSTTYHLNTNIEWCWLDGDSFADRTCMVDSDCDHVKNNSCRGTCSVG
ncbi:hypothetical protein ACHWQZ_G014836 [Mnemiopsis leidyi]